MFDPDGTGRSAAQFVTLLLQDSNHEGVMGGKRSDQHNIARGEAGATDYKSLPDDEKVLNEDHEKYKSTEKRAQSSKIPESKLNPALEDVRNRKDVRGK
jgi:hypothetical protein